MCYEIANISKSLIDHCVALFLYIFCVGAMTFIVDLMRIKYGGLVEMNEGDIESADGIIEAEGHLNISGRGYASNSGPGAGGNYGDIGLGGANGGDGGAPWPQVGGTTYNSLYKPTDRGSGGGDAAVAGQGGAGGSYLR